MPPEPQIRHLLAVRLRRQEGWRSRKGLEPLRLIAVTRETSLRRLGGHHARAARSFHGPHVTLRVLPFPAKPVFSMTCMYALFEYKDVGESDVVHIETHAGFSAWKTRVKSRNIALITMR